MIKPFLRAKKLNFIVEELGKLFNKSGYYEILLPLYEFYDNLKDVAWDFKDENIIRFIDRHTGKSMVLRPDFTPQVCRFVSLYFKDFPIPIRVSYKGRIFRNVDLNKGLKSEKYQVGCELFGMKEFIGDTEIIHLAYNAIRMFDIKNFKIIIGDSQLVKLILNHFDMNEKILKFLMEKNFSGFRYMFENGEISRVDYEFLVMLTKSVGSEKVIEDIMNFKNIPDDIKGRLIYLKELFSNFKRLGIDDDLIIFDASEIRGFDYYTGVNFDVISSDGKVLAGGGRYDNLMDKFGTNMLACGFAVNVEELIDYVDVIGGDEIEYDYIVVGEENFITSLQLKDEGYNVLWVEEESEELNQFFKIKKIIK